jgi:tetratricopeptide (TPR) repeat protein
LFLNAYRARQAEAAFRKAVELNPDYLQPHERLVKLYAAQLRAAEIRQQLESIRRFRPWTLDELYILVYANGRMATSDQHNPHLERFVKADADDLHSRVALGRFHLRDEKYGEAASIFGRTLASHPDDSPARPYLAETLVAQSDLAGAAEVLAGAPADRHVPQSVWKSHGLFWIAVGNLQRGTDCLRRAVALDKIDLATTYTLAINLERIGDTGSSATFFKRVELLNELDLKMYAIIERDRARAADHLFDLVVRAGTLLLELDMNVEAAAFFEQALAWRPDSPIVRENHSRARAAWPAPAADENAVAAIIGPERDVVPPPNQALGSREFVRNPVPSRAPPAIHLVDRHQESGLNFRYFNGETGMKYVLESHGGGVAVLDYDGDGWPDLYFTQGGRIPLDSGDTTYVDCLYRNLGNGTCSDITTGSGLGDNQYSQGCAAGDYNNDGFPDLAVANFGTNRLYHNNGDGTFTDVAARSGIGGNHFSTSLAWGDLDRDGDLDLYIANYVLDPWRTCTSERGLPQRCKLRLLTSEDDLLYVNRGNGVFEDATRTAEMAGLGGKGLGVIIGDLDDDGWPDVYVANDGDPSFLFQNQGLKNGALKFAEVGLVSGTAVNGEGQAMAGMGIACADLDGNGRLDLYVTNFHREADTLYLNRGDMLFDEAASRAGLAQPTRLMTGWGTQAIDLDLDGWLDLFVANGHTSDDRDEGLPWKMPAQLFYNLGDGKFTDVSCESGAFFHGEFLGRGAARLDWNRDGRPDVVVVHHDRPAALLLNETRSTGHHLILDFRGVDSNRDAIGTRIRTTTAGFTQVLEICGGGGFMATNDLRQIVGLGSARKVDLLEIHWPSRREDRWTGIPADSELLLIEGRSPRIRVDTDSRP